MRPVSYLKLSAAAAAIVGTILIGAAVSSANVVDIPASQDATLLGGSDATTNNSLADPGIFVGTDGQGNPKRGLVEFNVATSQIPAGAIITGVTLQMDLGQVAGSGGGSGGGSGASETLSLYDEAQAWGQPTNVAGASTFSGTGHGGAPATGDATWNYAFYNTVPWTTVGGSYVSGASDRGDATVATALVPYSWSTSNMIADVQNWLDTPSSNNGWLLKNTDETSATDFRAFWSAQGAAAYLAANPTNPLVVSAPELIVSYTPVPEPKSLLVLAVTGLYTLTRRRKVCRV